MVVAIVVVLVAVLVAPAVAAPAPTTRQVSSASKTTTYGQGVVLNGTLKSGGVALGGLWVDFAQATTQANSCEGIYKVTTAGGAYSRGTQSIAVMPLQTMYYRFKWPGDSTYAAGNSDVVPASVKPSLGRPFCPTSAKPGKYFTAKCSVKPSAPTGPAVKIKAYLQRNGSWDLHKSCNATISGNQYSASIKPSHTGKYKFKAVSSSSAAFAAAESGYGSVTTAKK